MQIDTSRFEKIDIDENKIITFENGMLGFERVKEYIIVEQKNSDFCWLQAVKMGALAFPCIQPNKICEDYVANVDESICRELGLENDDDAFILCVVTVPRDVSQATVNLRAPVVINTANRKAAQVVLENNNYDVRHLLFAQ